MAKKKVSTEVDIAPSEETPATKQALSIDMRVLVDSEINGHKVRANDLVTVTDELMAELRANGIADDNADAVAYCKAEGAYSHDLTQG